jgi:hypothetical protein
MFPISHHLPGSAKAGMLCMSLPQAPQVPAPNKQPMQLAHLNTVSFSCSCSYRLQSQSQLKGKLCIPVCGVQGSVHLSERPQSKDRLARFNRTHGETFLDMLFFFSESCQAWQCRAQKPCYVVLTLQYCAQCPVVAVQPSNGQAYCRLQSFQVGTFPTSHAKRSGISLASFSKPLFLVCVW